MASIPKPDVKEIAKGLNGNEQLSSDGDLMSFAAKLASAFNLSANPTQLDAIAVNIREKASAGKISVEDAFRWLVSETAVARMDKQPLPFACPDQDQVDQQAAATVHEQFVSTPPEQKSVLVMPARPKPDIEEIRKGLELFVEPGSVHELRALDVATGNGWTATFSGYFDNLELMAKAAAQQTRHAAGVYMTLNPVAPELLARCANRTKSAKDTTKDHEILRRHWLFVDIDPATDSRLHSCQCPHGCAKIHPPRLKRRRSPRPNPVVHRAGAAHGSSKSREAICAELRSVGIDRDLSNHCLRVDGLAQHLTDADAAPGQ